jgi:hypothetical protein
MGREEAGIYAAFPVNYVSDPNCCWPPRNAPSIYPPIPPDEMIPVDRP